MITNLTRPRSVTMTLWVVFLLGGWNGGRVMAIGLNRRTLAAFHTTPAPGLRLGIALFWAVLFWSLTIALWRKRPFTRIVIPSLLGLYALSELGLLFLFARSTPARNSWLVNTLFYGLIILFSLWALNRTAVKPYFTNQGLKTKD